MDGAQKSSVRMPQVTPRDLIGLARDPDAVIAQVLLGLAQRTEPCETSMSDIMKALLDAPRPEPAEDKPPHVHKEPRLMYRVREVSEMTGISRSNIYVLMRAGRLPWVKLGRATRVRARDLEAFIEGLPTEPWR